MGDHKDLSIDDVRHDASTSREGVSFSQATVMNEGFSGQFLAIESVRTCLES